MKDNNSKWGITKDLQADIRYEENACKSYVMDLSLGCPHKCIYCLFSPLELKVYKLYNPRYTGDVVPLKLDKFNERTSFPPSVYLCYSSDPLGNDEIKESTKRVLEKLFVNNVNVLFITKGVFDDSMIDLIKKRPDLMNIQVDLSSCDDKRNEIIEPGAPTYNQRLENIKKLSNIKELASLSVRMDPLIPEVDDTEQNINRILSDISELGIKEVVVGYVVLTKNMLRSWGKHELINKATNVITEKTPTISGQDLFSLPYKDKVHRINIIKAYCENYDIKLSVCGCKDKRLKNLDIEWICHPFNRSRREEMNKNAPEDMILETEHLI